MGRIRIESAGEIWEQPLSTSTILGRHWSCDAQIRDRRVPMRWLELRWLQGIWAWRVNDNAHDTRGTGKVLDQGWRALAISEGEGGRVTCADVAQIQLIDAAPPAVFARDLASGAFLTDGELHEHFEVHGDEVFPIGAAEGPARPLMDGAVSIIRGRSLRIHIPSDPPATERMLINIVHHQVTLDIWPEELRAQFTLGREVVAASGECVRVLTIYAQARLDQGANEGWLSTDRAYTTWIQAGGNPESARERIGWEKGKLRTRLAQSGAVQVARLFEGRRLAKHSESRLATSPLQITIHGHK
jgi:hypothetical protein